MQQAKRVLLIDDEEAIVRVVGDVLQCFGYDVTLATSGAEGLRRVRDAVPDAVVCDLRMPQMGGEEVVLMLRSQPATAHLPIVLVSGYCEPTFAHLADAFLQKPFMVNELDVLIKRLVAERRSGGVTVTA